MNLLHGREDLNAFELFSLIIMLTCLEEGLTDKNESMHSTRLDNVARHSFGRPKVGSNMLIRFMLLN